MKNKRMMTVAAALFVAMLTILVPFSQIAIDDGEQESLNSPLGAEELDKWDGSTKEISPSDDVYVVNTASELAWISEQVTDGNSFVGKTVVLNADIDLNNVNWTPIGVDNKKPFNGTFDGQEHTVFNLYIDDDLLIHAGLFGYVAEKNGGGIIKNVNICNVDINAKSTIGSLAGSAYPGSVWNCHVSGLIKLTGNYKLGGLIGEGYATISDCSVVGDEGSLVEGIHLEKDLEGDNVGGLIGYTGEGNISLSRCYADIDVEGTRKIGGLIGLLNYSRTVFDCYALGNVSSNASSEYAKDNPISMGGLIGEFSSIDVNENSAPVTVKNCFAAGKVTPYNNEESELVGGIIGRDRSNNSGNCTFLNLYYLAKNEPSSSATSFGDAIEDWSKATFEESSSLVNDSSPEMPVLKEDYVAWNISSNSKSNDLHDAISAATDGDTIHLSSGTRELEKTLEISKNLIIKGESKETTTIHRATPGVVIDITYGDGRNVEISGITIDGQNGGGALQWTIDDSYKNNNTPAKTPNLHIYDCIFKDSSKSNFAAAIGLWGNPNRYDLAASNVVIENCIFRDLTIGIYFEEEAPLINLKSTISENVFEAGLIYCVMGLPANSLIENNNFMIGTSIAIQYLFNEKQEIAKTEIKNNTIDSEKGIEFMPYRLNEGNNSEQIDGKTITADLVPKITHNIRNVDATLTTLMAYHTVTDETIVFKDEAIDLSYNYCNGEAPEIKVVVKEAVNGHITPNVDDLLPQIVYSPYYLDSTLTKLNTDPVDPPYIPPYVPPVITPEPEPETPVVPTPDEEGNVEIQVPVEKVDEIVEEAKNNGSSSVTVADLSTVEGAASATVSTSDLQNILDKIETDDSLTNVQIELPEGSVTIEKEVLTEILQTTEAETLTIKVSDVSDEIPLTEEQKKIIGNSSVFDISIIAGEKKVTSFSGKTITVCLPYELKDGEDPSKIVVYYVKDDGSVEKMDCVYKDGNVYFETNHLSHFSIVYEAEPVAADDPSNDDNLLYYVLAAIVIILVIIAVAYWVMKK